MQHGFLIVTVSSGIIAALPQLVSNPTSVPSLLASQLPLASTFFLTYVYHLFFPSLKLTRVLPAATFSSKDFPVPLVHSCRSSPSSSTTSNSSSLAVLPAPSTRSSTVVAPLLGARSSRRPHSSWSLRSAILSFRPLSTASRAPHSFCSTCSTSISSFG